MGHHNNRRINMTHDKHPTQQDPVNTSAASQPDGAAAAFIAAITDTMKSLRDWFRGAAIETATVAEREPGPNLDHDSTDPHETAIRLRYADAALHWNQLNARALAHGVSFSLTAQAHHRAAILDALDDPHAPTLLTHKHLTWAHVVDEDGYADNCPTHPAARALYRLRSCQFPALYPPERNSWNDAQWREHESRQDAEWLAKMSPETRRQLDIWARRVNVERDAGTSTTSWRAPGHHGPRRRPSFELV
jgi:hypothetical protein